MTFQIVWVTCPGVFECGQLYLVSLQNIECKTSEMKEEFTEVIQRDIWKTGKNLVASVMKTVLLFICNASVFKVLWNVNDKLFMLPLQNNGYFSNVNTNFIITVFSFCKGLPRVDICLICCPCEWQIYQSFLSLPQCETLPVVVRQFFFHICSIFFLTIHTQS